MALTYDRVASALEKTAGNQAEAARKLGVSRQALNRWVTDYPGLREIIADSSEVALDVAESRLLSAVKRGEAWAVRLMLTTKGRSRGYSTRVDVNLPGNTTIVFSADDAAVL